MTAAHIVPRELAFYVATTFDSSGGPADWSSNGIYCHATEVDVTGLKRAVIENKNIRRSLRRHKHKNILGLRSAESTIGLSFYAHSSPSHAAEAAAATTFHLSTLVKCALGGMDLGYAIGLDSSGAEGADEIELDSDPGYAVGDALFVYDTSATRGEFYITNAIAAGPPVTISLDRDLHFAVDAGGADRTYAVIDCWIDDEVTTDRASSDHTTLWVRAQGDTAEDVYTAMGVKLQLGQITITAGEPVELPMEGPVVTHTHETDTAEDFSAATIYGSAGVVPGISDQTLCKIAASGSPLANADFYGSITIDFGVKYEQLIGPNGWDGVHGYTDTGDETTIEIMVDFDDDWTTGFHAQTTYALMIQIGVGTDAIGFYFPRLELSAMPTREDVNNLTCSKLTFRALGGTADTTGLSAVNARKLNAPAHLFFVA